jgi:hypothetical protein
MSASHLTSILIWLPIAGAVLIWLLPLSRYATGALALLISFAEVGLWIKQAAHFDFSQPGLQMSGQANWFGDLGVSYHVGVYGFSLWLVGLWGAGVLLLSLRTLGGWALVQRLKSTGLGAPPAESAASDWQATSIAGIEARRQIEIIIEQATAYLPPKSPMRLPVCKAPIKHLAATHFTIRRRASV